MRAAPRFVFCSFDSDWVSFPHIITFQQFTGLLSYSDQTSDRDTTTYETHHVVRWRYSPERFSYFPAFGKLGRSAGASCFGSKSSVWIVKSAVFYNLSIHGRVALLIYSRVCQVSTKLCDPSLPNAPPKVLCVHACQVPPKNLSRLLILLPSIDRPTDRQRQTDRDRQTETDRQTDRQRQRTRYLVV